METDSKLNILVAHGVNLDLLGQREPEIYGHDSLVTIANQLEHFASTSTSVSGKGISLTFFQTNKESEYLEKISGPWDGALLNPGAWTHTSLALADRLVATHLKFVEVHLSNLSCREQFRQHSFLSPHAVGVVSGFGAPSYLAGLVGLLQKI